MQIGTIHLRIVTDYPERPPFTEGAQGGERGLPGGRMRVEA
jgi:hypothetical protein